MEFKTVLAVVGADHFREDARNAIALCQAAGAHLSVMMVAIASPPPMGDYGEVASTAWLQDRQSALANLGKQHDAVEEMLKSSGLSYEISDLYTEFIRADQDIARKALHGDLTLIGRQAAEDENLRKRIFAGALFQSPSPVMTNPTERPATLTPRSVLIAWDGGSEAARATQMSLSILQSAAEVHVTLVDPVTSSGGNGQGAAIATHLARHDVKVDIDILSSRGESIADVLMRHAAAVRAELVVMGAYSHSRLRERIFGGVTQTMLEKAKLPIFWGH